MFKSRNAYSFTHCQKSEDDQKYCCNPEIKHLLPEARYIISIYSIHLRPEICQNLKSFWFDDIFDIVL